jgi:hypothetical protein
VSDALDKHLDEAFASLDALSMRELEATAEALGRRRNELGSFSSVFRNVASSREFGSDLHLARFHLRECVSHDGDELAEQIAGAEAPFGARARGAESPAGATGFDRRAGLKDVRRPIPDPHFPVIQDRRIPDCGRIKARYKERTPFARPWRPLSAGVSGVSGSIGLAQIRKPEGLRRLATGARIATGRIWSSRIGKHGR